MSLLKYEYDKKGNRYIVTIDGEKVCAHEIYVNGQKIAKESGLTLREIKELVK